MLKRHNSIHQKKSPIHGVGPKAFAQAFPLFSATAGGGESLKSLTDPSSKRNYKIKPTYRASRHSKLSNRRSSVVFGLLVSREVI